MSISDLAARCRGRWSEVVLHCAPSEAMRAAIERGSRRHGPCPVHGGIHGDGFRVFPDHDDSGGAVCASCGSFASGFSLINWLNGWRYGETAKAIEAYLDGTVCAAPARVSSVRPVVRNTRQGGPSKAYLEELWSQAHELSSNEARPMRLYLERRGLPLEQLTSLRSLRCHPSLGYYRDDDRSAISKYPTMLARLEDVDGRLVGLHRTYLSDDGTKAPELKVKKMMMAREAQLSGAAVRLTPAARSLSITEGIENALSVFAATQSPVWAASSASMLAAVVVPSVARKVVIWADADVPKRQPNGRYREAGREAAVTLMQRLAEEGRDVVIMTPPGPIVDQGRDWNDVFCAEGRLGFPSADPLRSPLPSLLRLSQPMRS